MATPLYDPYAHADQMGVRIYRHTLHDCYGAWIPGKRAILLDRNIPAEFEVPVLAHECDHAEHNDPPGHHVRYEARANLHAAQRLIVVARFDDLMSVHTDYDLVCLELGVTREQLIEFAKFRRDQIAKKLRLHRLGQAVYMGPKMGAGQYIAKFEVA